MHMYFELKLRCVGHLALLCGAVASLEIFSVRAMGDPAPPALMAPPAVDPVAVESASAGAEAVGRCGGGCAVVLRRT